MRLTSITVENFRAITSLELRDVGDAVVLAGPNGCGKSCVLDAVRLLKSAYGSYEQDEWNMWLGEFQISVTRDAGELVGLLQDKTKPLRVVADFVLSSAEKEYLAKHAGELVELFFWRQNDPNRVRGGARGSFSAAHRVQQAQLDNAKAQTVPHVMRALDQSTQRAALTIDPSGVPATEENRLLELVFCTYLPQSLGVIDYHGPNRTYGRQKLDSVNLTIDASETKRRQTALYNSSNKYANLKTEMTSAYIRHLLSAKANPGAEAEDSLTSTLKELFTTFFPGKEFLGPRPTVEGRLTFLVRLAAGGEHDIDDLSSGEKEVLYGYLQLHSSAPRDSMILIDEPELHLNPRLVSGLAAFYYRHLGTRLGNQLWLVSHSDTLIREAVAHPRFSVFHIQPPAEARGTSQATPVKVQGDLEKVVLALVGDLAAYRPGAKVVVFESTGDAAFDARMTCTLFPEFDQGVNPISAGSKRRVSDLYELLEHARREGHLDARFFAVTDADDMHRVSGPSSRFEWDVYHIENYLLQPEIIQAVLSAAGVKTDVARSSAAVLSELQACAESSIPDLVAHRMRAEANRLLVSSIDLGFDLARRDVGVALAEAVERSFERIRTCVAGDVNRAQLAKLEGEHTGRFRASLGDGTWRSVLRGRDILRRFAGKHLSGMQYEYFRDLVINKMAEVGYQPLGMGRVVYAILRA